MRYRWVGWLIALVAVAWLLRAPFLDRELWNLDEGSTFTMAQQVREGAVMYRDCADNRAPLVPYLKAIVYLVCGDWNIRAQHQAAVCGWGLCAFGLLALARRLEDRAAGCWTAIAFTVIALLLPGAGESLALHTEVFVVFFSTLGFWCFARALDRGGVLAGVPIGLSFAASSLCKQPGLLDFVVVWVVVALIAWRRPAERGRLGRILLGAAAAFAAAWMVTCTYFVAHGSWRDFVYYAWTFNARLYVPEVPLLQRLAVGRLSWDLAVRWIPAALVLGLPGLAWSIRAVWRGIRRSEQTFPVLPLVTLGWAGSGLVSTMLSGRPFTHYAIQTIPGLSLACGLTIARALEALRRARVRRPSVAGMGAIALAAVAVWTCWSAREFGRQVERHDSPTDAKMRELVQCYTSEHEPILVWGYYPEAYAIAHRMPATRFLYTNYLTGMLPWTNLDPETDTRYAIVPGSWDAFWKDYRASQPRLVVDATIRGYLKYPLLSQPVLRDELIDHFAEVEPTATRSLEARLYSRLATPDSSLAGLTAVIDPAVQLDVALHGRQPDLVLAAVQAPPGVTEVTLRIGGRPYRRFVPPSGRAVETRFLIRLADLAGSQGAVVDALVRREGGLVASTPVDVARRLVLNLRSVDPAPVLEYGSRRLSPVSDTNRTGWQPEPREELAGWRGTGPFDLTFERLRNLQMIHFSWLPAVGDDAGSGGGKEEIEALLSVADGPPEILPLKSIRGPGGLRHVTVELPGGEPGRVTLRFSASSAIWLGGLRGDAHGPPLHFGDRSISPAYAIQNDFERMTAAGDGSWDVRAFGRLLYGRQPGMEGLVIEYGVRDSAYVPGQEAGAPHLIVEINLLHDDGRSENLMSRGLEPALRPEDRGPQTDHLSLPDKGSGDIEVRFVPYGSANPNNRGYLRRIRAQGAGPEIVVTPDRALVPVQSWSADGGRIRARTANGWMAHSPSRVEYACPPDLRAITFGFGLDDPARADENGRRRSDGIDAVVEFIDAEGKVTLLYRRTIDPFAVVGDRGTQRARVVLPGAAGRLAFQITPGPHNDSAYDWSYLTDMAAETGSEQRSTPGEPANP